MTDGQLELDMSATLETRGTDRHWLGLVTNHRRLFDALQDGWLQPLPSDDYLVMGIDKYARERASQSPKYPISVRMKLDLKKLPNLEVVTRHHGEWLSRPLDAIESSDGRLCWPGALPAFAISEFSVSTEEQRAHLVGLARQVANVQLSDVDVTVGDRVVEVDVPNESAPSIVSRLVIPDELDAILGAMCMAIWAVPRVDPWMALLTETLAADSKRLAALTTELGARWWRFPLWATRKKAEPTDLQDSLWLSAMEVFQEQSGDRSVRSSELADQIASTVCTAHADETARWCQATHSILRADTLIQFDHWQECPVGIAIQLVLTRAEPAKFKTWFHDRPNLAPAVAWSAAALCGLLSGYKRLGNEFRGDADQRAHLCIHALRACSTDTSDVRWRAFPAAGPTWRNQGAYFILSWGGHDFRPKPKNARGKWFAADFSDKRVNRMARAAAKGLGWLCTRRELCLQDSRLPFSGSGTITVQDGSKRVLDVRGETRVILPQTVTLEEVFEVNSFLNLVATQAARIPDPPTPTVSKIPVESSAIPGFVYVPEFLSKDEERELVEKIDQCDWIQDLSRRVQHYGWRYDYKSRQVTRSMKLGPLPDWLSWIAQRLVEAKLVYNYPDQVIVNEYVGSQGISRHIDSASSFADGIVTISLLESWEMVLNERKSRRKATQILERRSAAVMNGAARFRWTHEIPKRKTEPSLDGINAGRVRGRRISLTFRKLVHRDEP